MKELETKVIKTKIAGLPVALRRFGFAVCTMVLMWNNVPCMRAETFDSYGNEFIAITNNKPSEGCLITALFESTTVTLSNGTQFVLHRGEKRWIAADTWTTDNGARSRTLYIRANEPIQVLHTTSVGETYVSTSLPSLTCEAQSEQRFVFVQRALKSNLFIITPSNQTTGFLIDGKVLRPESFYTVSGNSEWAYAVVDLGVRKAGSMLNVYAPTNEYHAAVVANSYEYLTPCELEASVSIDTLRSKPQYILHPDPTWMVSSEMADSQSTGAFEEEEEEEEEEESEEKTTFHRASLYLQGAYAALPLKMENYSTSNGLGYGAAAGVLYEFQHKSFLMQTGAGFYWLDRRVNILNQPAPERYDRDIRGGIEIPLLFGQNFRPVYYLLGMKLGFDILNRQITACRPNMVSQTQVMAPIVREGDYRVAFDFDPRICAEFGVNLGQERNDWVHSRLAIFADWGFYPTNLSRTLPTDEPNAVSTTVGDPEDYGTYHLTHFYALPQSCGQLLQHFQIGLKFTLVLGE